MGCSLSMEFAFIFSCMREEKPSLLNLHQLAYVCVFETAFGFEMFLCVPVLNMLP